MKILSFFFIVWAIIEVCDGEGVSTRMDFVDESTSISNSTNADDEDVEVKHTIVVSTKLKNNFKKGIRSSDGDSGTLHYNVGDKNSKKEEDSGEIPIIYSSKSADSTVIRTPDTRHTKIYPDSVFITRNVRDQYDNVYPNVAANPMQWQPSSFYNNINYNANNRRRNLYNSNPNPKLHRKSDDGAIQFYCRKCAELRGSIYKGCSPSSVVQHRSANRWTHETTTPKIKVDGKLAKLN